MYSGNHHNLWIKVFLFEFMKKWTSIDFLRLDKYIMLVQTVLTNYLDKAIEGGILKNIYAVFDFLCESRKGGFYNFNFIACILKPISNALEKLIYIGVEPDDFKSLIEKVLNVSVVCFTF
jgi:hypothetical protein